MIRQSAFAIVPKYKNVKNLKMILKLYNLLEGVLAAIEQKLQEYINADLIAGEFN